MRTQKPFRRSVNPIRNRSAIFWLVCFAPSVFASPPSLLLEDEELLPPLHAARKAIAQAKWKQVIKRFLFHHDVPLFN